MNQNNNTPEETFRKLKREPDLQKVEDAIHRMYVYNIDVSDETRAKMLASFGYTERSYVRAIDKKYS